LVSPGPFESRNDKEGLDWSRETTRVRPRVPRLERLEAGKIAAFSIGQGYLLGVTVYVLIPSLLLFLSLVLPVRVTRMTNVVVAGLYAVTVAGSAIGEWSYYILGSLTEAALLAAVVYYAWTWPKATDAVDAPSDASRTGTRLHSQPKVRG
jgi:hypothetical protein